MKETLIIERERVKPKDPVLVVGLPGIGLIGRVVGRYLVEELKGQRIADLYSPHFPHQVFMTKKGGMRLIRNKFYFLKGKKQDVIVLTGDVQAISSVGQYEVSGVIIDYLKKLGVKTILTVGGYSTGKIQEQRRVFGVSTTIALKKEFEKKGVVFGLAKGSIVGAAGLLPSLGRLRGIQGICIMGETHGSYVDISSAKAIVSLLSEYFDFQLNLSKLDKKAKESEKILRKVEEEIEKNSVLPYQSTDRSTSYIR
ncbi:MAG: proteasome assembly chaperone family protein [Candidatus Micrarchaeota archaeon]